MSNLENNGRNSSRQTGHSSQQSGHGCQQSGHGCCNTGHSCSHGHGSGGAVSKTMLMRIAVAIVATVALNVVAIGGWWRFASFLVVRWRRPLSISRGKGCHAFSLVHGEERSPLFCRRQKAYSRQHPCCPDLDDCREPYGRERCHGESGSQSYQ